MSKLCNLDCEEQTPSCEAFIKNNKKSNIFLEMVSVVMPQLNKEKKLENEGDDMHQGSDLELGHDGYVL